MAIFVSALVARACTAGSRTVPEVVAKTTWSELPDAAGKSFCSRLIAVAESVFGKVNLVEKAVPTAWLAPAVKMSAASQRASTIHR